MQSITDFYSNLYSFYLSHGNIDEMKWINDKNSRFSVKSDYKALLNQSHYSYPWNIVWKTKVSTKVAFFSQLASLGKILTTDNLRKRGISITDWSYLCKQDEESVDHLFLHCKVANSIWFDILKQIWDFLGNALSCTGPSCLLEFSCLQCLPLCNSQDDPSVFFGAYGQRETANASKTRDAL